MKPAKPCRHVPPANSTGLHRARRPLSGADVGGHGAPRCTRTGRQIVYFTVHMLPLPLLLLCSERHSRACLPKPSREWGVFRASLAVLAWLLLLLFWDVGSVMACLLVVVLAGSWMLPLAWLLAVECLALLCLSRHFCLAVGWVVAVYWTFVGCSKECGSFRPCCAT